MSFQQGMTVAAGPHRGRVALASGSRHAGKCASWRGVRVSICGAWRKREDSNPNPSRGRTVFETGRAFLIPGQLPGVVAGGECSQTRWSGRRL